MQTGQSNGPDWEVIKAGWLAGKPAVRALARTQGVSDTAIHKRAKTDNWGPRGSAAKADCKPERKPEQTRSENEARPVSAIIERAADADPSELSKAGRVIIDMLMRELMSVSQHVDLIERIIEEETRGDKSPKRRQLLMRIVSLPMRTQAAKNLAGAITTLAEAGPGKKKQAQDAAANVGGAGSVWGDDLTVGAPASRAN